MTDFTDFSEKTHVSFESRFKLHLKNPSWGVDLLLHHMENLS